MPIQLYPKKPRIRSNCYASARAQYRVIAERQNLPERRLNGDDSLGGDQLTEALPGEDHHVGRHAAGELRGNRLRPCSLQRTRSGRDLDAARPLEFRQQLLVRATESAGYQNVHCADAATSQNGGVAKITNEKVFMISSSPTRSRASDETLAHHARQGGRCKKATVKREAEKDSGG